MDIGESLVGAYYRSVVGCHSVTYNTFLPDSQGEIDVIGLHIDQGVDVFAAEVAIHLDSLNYGGYEKTATKVLAKMRAARKFVDLVYDESHLTLEFWSPVVPSGLVKRIEDIQEEVGFRLVANQDFTDRIRMLTEAARVHTKTTGEPAYRMLQILTHLRGEGLGI